MALMYYFCVNSCTAVLWLACWV